MTVTASVTVTVDDNDKPGITFTPASLTVGEGGGDTYNVKLNTAPTADVTVAISSDNPDVTVTPNNLTFTSLNFAANQQVTVTAAEDADAADDTANLTHRPSGGGYGSGQNKDFIVTVTDYDIARLELSDTFLDVDEGGQNTYTVKLQTPPTTTVTVTVSSDDPDAATVSGSTLRFTTSNWDTAQTVTVRGVNDGDLINEVVTLTNTASGGEYAGVTETVRVTVEDDDTAGITFTPAARTIREGATGTYDVKLNSSPTAEVTVAISSDNPDVTVNMSSLTFTTANYARNQQITVTAGQDADAADDTANLTHRPSGGGYSAGEAKDFMVTVTDDDTAGLVLSATTLGVDEAGQNTYTVKLKTQPTVTVTVTVSSDDLGAAPATASGSNLIFTASNWDTEQTVTVAGVDDDDSANETVTVTNTAFGGEYAGVTASVRVTVDDDDKPGINFTPASLTVGEGGVGTYGVKLNTLPTGNVTVAISSSNPDVTVTPNNLTFTSSNWETEQTVDVTATEDADAADDTANLTHRPSGGGYGSGQNKTFVVTVTDDDTAGLMLSTTTLDVDEGGQNTYTVKLQTQPTTTVTVTVSSDDPDAATVSGSTLRFTTSNWATAQTVTVRGVNDIDLINEVVKVTNTASGGEYAGVAETVTVTVEDTGMNPPPPPPPPPPQPVVGGGFGPALEAPQFVDGFRTSRPLDVTARAGDAVGDPVAATHPNDDDVTYSLSGANAALFTVDEETGQIRLGQVVTLALGQTYTVNLTATDSSGTGAIIIVDIEVAEGVGDPYDLNRDGIIGKDEVLEAVSDYFSGLIEKDEVLALVARYFAA